MNLRRIVGGLVNDQIRSRPLIRMQILGDELNHSQVVVPQTTSTVDGHSPNKSTVGDKMKKG
jgi:hypothetical protein